MTKNITDNATPPGIDAFYRKVDLGYLASSISYIYHHSFSWEDIRVEGKEHVF